MIFEIRIIAGCQTVNSENTQSQRNIPDKKRRHKINLFPLAT